MTNSSALFYILFSLQAITDILCVCFFFTFVFYLFIFTIQMSLK